MKLRRTKQTIQMRDDADNAHTHTHKSFSAIFSYNLLNFILFCSYVVFARSFIRFAHE